MKITVFTPTYNRGYIIENLYNSLKKQKYKNFEWLVIDDGSIDNTESLFKHLIEEKKHFEIRYFKMKNGGKHRAINKGLDLAKGELFFIVDSDDYLTDNALERIVKYEDSIEDKNLFCGVSGNKGKDVNGIWGTTFNEKFMDCTYLERKKYNISGDKAEAYYTNVLKKYKFPEFEGENFITEATVWNKIAYNKLKLRYFNETIYIADYLEDGLSNAGDSIFSKNPRGTAYYYNQQIDYNNFGLKDKLSYYNMYYELVKKSNVDIETAAKYLEINKSTLILSITLVKIKNFILNRK